jgi:hypothetical protein
MHVCVHACMYACVSDLHRDTPNKNEAKHEKNVLLQMQQHFNSAQAVHLSAFMNAT